MQLHGHDIAVCSWSLRTKTSAQLVRNVRELGLDHVQLALAELAPLVESARDEELAVLRDSGLKFTGGMVAFKGEDYGSIDAIRKTGGFVPDDDWTARQDLTRRVAALAAQLGLKHVTTHIGFVPGAGESGYATIVERVRAVAEDFTKHGLSLLMETGQEPAGELLEFLHALNAPNVKINFDPANMILYGAGDPIAAVRTLGSHIGHVHLKDGTPSDKPGETWGAEVPFGTGAVNPGAFLDALRSVNYTGPLAIEREAGDNRAGDVRHAIDVLKALPAR